MTFIAPLDLTRFRVLKAEESGVWLQVWHKEIKTSDGCIFGGFAADFPIFVKYEELPLPEQDKRAIRWAERICRRFEEQEARAKLQGMTLGDFVNSIYLKAIGESVTNASVIAQRSVVVAR